jgi:glycosyltransferase involved in cell wall biosynthesis
VPPGEYLLYVSTLDFYKAQVEVVRAFSLLRERRPTREKLVLAGPEYGPYGALVRDEIRKLGLEGDVVVTGEKPYESLPGAYRHAKLVVFASECEVCPNILLEAMAAGRPLVCSRRQPMPEFARDAVRYFDPAAPEELAREVAAVIDRPDVLEDLARRAEARSRDFDWARTTARTWEAILQAVRERRAARGGAEERRG